MKKKIVSLHHVSCFKYNVGINIKVIFIPENIGRKADKSEVIFR